MDLPHRRNLHRFARQAERLVAEGGEDHCWTRRCRAYILHRIEKSKDLNFWSLRVNRDLRIIVSELPLRRPALVFSNYLERARIRPYCCWDNAPGQKPGVQSRHSDGLRRSGTTPSVAHRSRRRRGRARLDRDNSWYVACTRARDRLMVRCATWAQNLSLISLTEVFSLTNPDDGNVSRSLRSIV